MKRFICIACAGAIALGMFGCSPKPAPGTADSDEPATVTAEEEPLVLGADIALNGGQATVPQIGLVDDETGAIGPVITMDPYASGIHHATLTIEGYDSMELEIYSNTAPKTSALFCYLVRHKYYNGLQITALMPDLYAKLGDYSGKTKNKYVVDGEFDEAGVDNSIGLKRGVIAMGRQEEDENLTGPSVLKSDASNLYIFLSDTSYLDGKYAGFAKISRGVSTLDSIVASIGSTDGDGTISIEEECPVIKNIKLTD